LQATRFVCALWEVAPQNFRKNRGWNISMAHNAGPGEVTALLRQWSATRPGPPTQLISLVYSDLRKMASAYMRHEDAAHILQATALVHEAYLRLYRGAPFQWENRGQFFGVMAQTMRRILVDYARARNAGKRWNERKKVELSDVTMMAEQRPAELVALDEALAELAKLNSRQGAVVELLWFVGLTRDEAAAVLDVSSKTVQNDWRFARAWLQHRLGAVEPGHDPRIATA
jgi:RNA polymerase sigma factor (TIGR02999 family)